MKKYNSIVRAVTAAIESEMEHQSWWFSYMGKLPKTYCYGRENNWGRYMVHRPRLSNYREI